MPYTPGHTYTINNQRFRCKKVRQSGLNTFQLVDDNGEDAVVYSPTQPNLILDYGIRIIKK